MLAAMHVENRIKEGGRPVTCRTGLYDVRQHYSGLMPIDLAAEDVYR